MNVEPAVSRRKFDSEVLQLEKESPSLIRWGCFVVRAEYPEIDILIVHRRPLAISVPVQPNPGQNMGVQNQAVQFQMIELPMLSGRAFGIRLLLDDYDLRPPSVTIRDPFTWEALPYPSVVLANLKDASGKVLNIVLPSHPRTGLPFLCVRGTREYHEHPQHTGDDWQLYRPESSVFSLVTHIWSALVGTNRPNLVLQPPKGMQLRWELVEK